MFGIAAFDSLATNRRFCEDAFCAAASSIWQLSRVSVPPLTEPKSSILLTTSAKTCENWFGRKAAAPRQSSSF
jgi:hypothetical protein